MHRGRLFFCNTCKHRGRLFFNPNLKLYCNHLVHPSDCMLIIHSNNHRDLSALSRFLDLIPVYCVTYFFICFLLLREVCLAQHIWYAQHNNTYSMLSTTTHITFLAQQHIQNSYHNTYSMLSTTTHTASLIYTKQLTIILTRHLVHINVPIS